MIFGEYLGDLMCIYQSELNNFNDYNSYYNIIYRINKAFTHHQ